MSSVISRVFMNGNSQAVRIPQEFRLDASRVLVSRNDQGDLVIHPIQSDRGKALLEALEGFEQPLADELAALVTQDRRSQVMAQERDAL